MKYALVIAVACCWGLAQAQDGNPAHGPDNGAATHSVARYLGLERALHNAIGRHDGAAFEAMVDPDFELRTPAAQDTQTRGDWLKGVYARPGQVGALTVREQGELALVSFVLDTRSGKRPGPRYFVVDVWRQSDATLQARFIAPAGRAPAQVHKPDGRE